MRALWQRMIWADRIAAGAGAFIITLGLAFYLLFMIGTQFAGFFWLLVTVLEYSLMAAAAVSLPLWLILRVTDLFQGGPRLRREAKPPASAS